MASQEETCENEEVSSCIIEATVPTGFEMVAAEEAKEVFNTECRTLRGKIQFEVPVSRVNEIVELGGIDHCRAQILHVPCFGFTPDGDDCLARLCLLVKDGNWAEGLKIWSKFHTFDHPVSHQPQRVFTDEELIDVVHSVHMPGHKSKPKEDQKNGNNTKRGRKDRKRGRETRGQKNEDDKVGQSKSQPFNDTFSQEEEAANGGKGEASSEDEFIDALSSEHESKDGAVNIVTEHGDAASVKPASSFVSTTEAGDASITAQLSQESVSTKGIEECAEVVNCMLSKSSLATPIKRSSSVDPEDPNHLDQQENQNRKVADAESSVDPVTATLDGEPADEGAQSSQEHGQLEETGDSCTDAPVAASATVSPEIKKKRELDPTKPAFRVTCKRNGENHSFDSMSAAASFGSAVQKYFGWNVDMTNFNIEIVLAIDNNDVSFGLALTPESLHRRNVVAFGVTTLRPTICHNMLRMVKVRPGHIVCDPLCGTSSISIQGATKFPALQICGDNSGIAMEKTQINRDAMNKKRQQEGRGAMMMDAVRWNACHLPVRDGMVDVFVSDLPFGKRLGKKEKNLRLYRNVLEEMARCSKNGGRAALLTGDIQNMHKAILNQRYWSRRRVYSCTIGGISACVFLLFRESVPFVKREWRASKDADTAKATEVKDVKPCGTMDNL